MAAKKKKKNVTNYTTRCSRKGEWLEKIILKQDNVNYMDTGCWHHCLKWEGKFSWKQLSILLNMLIWIQYIRVLGLHFPQAIRFIETGKLQVKEKLASTFSICIGNPKINWPTDSQKFFTGLRQNFLAFWPPATLNPKVLTSFPSTIIRRL